MNSVRKLRSRKSNVQALMIVPSEGEVPRASVVRITVTGEPGLTEQSVGIRTVPYFPSGIRGGPAK